MARRHSIFSGSRFILKALVFTLVATAVWLLANVGSLREFLDTYHRRKAEEDQIAILRTRIENLKGQQRSLELGGVETERQVRERFRMHKPGEQVIFLEEADDQATNTAAGDAVTTATAQAAAATTQPAPLASSARGPDGAAARRTAQRGAPARATAEPGASTSAAEARDASANAAPAPTASANAAPGSGDPALALPSRPRLEGNRALPGPARKP